MTPAEAAALLTIAAAYDNRKPDADAAKAWSMALDGLRFEDCRIAVVNHYRRSREWLMPVDVVEAVKRIRFDRVAAFGPYSPPEGIDPDKPDYQRWLADTTRRIADGELTDPAELDPPGLAARELPSLDGVMPRVPAEYAKARAALRRPEPEEAP